MFRDSTSKTPTCVPACVRSVVKGRIGPSEIVIYASYKFKGKQPAPTAHRAVLTSQGPRNDAAAFSAHF